MKGFVSIVRVSVVIGVIAGVTNALVPRASSIKPVTIKGNAFFVGDERFYIRGVDYQPGGSSNLVDPLADVEVCKRDIVRFKELKINTIRIYTIDNSVDHTECMNALADAGIYLALDANTPKYSLRQDKPAQSYNGVYLQNIFATIDEFQKYPNTLMFFSGNEVINDVPTSQSAPWIKAVTRDMKQYIGTRNYRKIPVGYSAADIDDNRLETAHYMNCGTDDSRVDFFGFNDYSWCNPSTYTTSTWSDKVEAFKDYSVPIFLSEYGCIKTKRTFDEVSELYSEKMTPVYSGGLVYEYTEEGDSTQSKYGLVQITGKGASPKPDFETLRDAFENTPVPKGDGGFKSSGSPSECPPRSDTFLVDNNDLPAMPESAKKFFKNGAGKGVGLEGTGSQDVGAESTGTAPAGSGAVTETVSGPGSGSTPSGAAGHLRAPAASVASIVCGLVLVASSFIGATLL